MILNIVAYNSFYPGVVFFVLLLSGLLLMTVIPIFNSEDQFLFVYICAFLFMISGISSVYVQNLGDMSQLEGDAGWFYEQSKAGFANDENTTMQGSIVIFSEIYRLFSKISIPNDRYVGVFFNIFLVSFSSIFALKICDRLYAGDRHRKELFKRMIVFSPILFLFATTHLRDASIYLAFTMYFYSWVSALKNKITLMRLFLLIAVNVVFIILLPLLRNEYLILVPMLTILGFLVLINKRTSVGGSLVKFTLMLLTLVLVLVVTNMSSMMSLYDQVMNMYSYYHDLVKAASSAGLGYTLIIDQPIPIRLLFGYVYIFLHPIPFWAGSPFSEVYDLFKSLNAIYYYFVAPSIALGIWNIWKNRRCLSPALLFVFASFLLLISAVVMTSLETRHIGVFVFLAVLIAVAPDYRNLFNKYHYRSLLKLMLSFVFIVHMLWVIVKV